MSHAEVGNGLHFMRVPHLEQSPSTRQKIALFLCGTLIGCLLMTAIMNEHVQFLHDQTVQYKQQNQTLTEQVANYEKVRNQRQVIVKTSIHWDQQQKPLEKAVLSGLELLMTRDLKVIINKPVQWVDVYRSILQGKVYYDVHGADYRVRVTMLAEISSELIFYVIAEEFVAN